jgi:hypothetical protein
MLVKFCSNPKFRVGFRLGKVKVVVGLPVISKVAANTRITLLEFYVTPNWHNVLGRYCVWHYDGIPIFRLLHR